jgi:hypothetical protein
VPWRLAFLLLVFLLGLAAHAADGPRNGVVLIIRHAEKPADGPGLTPRGEERAKAYPRYFRNFTVDGKPLHLDHIFAAADSDESQRPRLTVWPLARSLGLPVDARFKTKQSEAVAGLVAASRPGSSILICWRHGELPELLGALGASPDAILPKGKWPDETFDWVIQLRYDAKGNLIPAATKRINENLFPGDSK